MDEDALMLFEVVEGDELVQVRTYVQDEGLMRLHVKDHRLVMDVAWRMCRLLTACESEGHVLLLLLLLERVPVEAEGNGGGVGQRGNQWATGD